MTSFNTPLQQDDVQILIQVQTVDIQFKYKRTSHLIYDHEMEIINLIFIIYEIQTSVLIPSCNGNVIVSCTCSIHNIYLFFVIMSSIKGLVLLDFRGLVEVFCL